MVTASRNGSRPKTFRSAADVEGRIEAKFRTLTQVHDRMDKDWGRYTLERWQPEFDDALGDEDIYTTNEPRVLAEKIIAFISATVPVIIADNSNAQEQQEETNDLIEQLAIGMLNNADQHHRRNGDPRTQDQLAFYAVVRGRYAAARAILRKRPNGDTFEDILPLDPRHLVVQRGDGEPAWAAYRMRWTAGEVKDTFPGFGFRDLMSDEESVDVFEYYSRETNPDFVPFSPDPFERHPYRYMAGTIIDSKWARNLHDIHMLNFPVVIAPVTAQPLVTPSEQDDTLDVSFGESVFAENRMIWDTMNRAASQILNLMGKAVDPRKKVYSLDGTKGLDDGSEDPGAEINLSTANQEEVENFEEADVNNSAAVLLQVLRQDAVAGGLPPQAFGLLDKPLSSVALRQLGNNLEHRVLPRMRAVASCLEGCLENLIAQYETGAFNPITASGRRYDNHRFANRVISPEEVIGHDPVEVRMDLALPEDEASRWSLAQVASGPTATGEPLASPEWVRENILKMQSHKLIHRQNLEAAAESSSPVARALSMYLAALRDGNNALAAIWYDELQKVYLQTQVEGFALAQQVQMAFQGIPIQPPDALIAQSPSAQTASRDASSFQNPANGAPGVAERRGIGNAPSPDAGFNTTAPRQRDTGLLGPAGQPLLAEE